MSLENNTEYIVEDLILHDEKQYSIEPDEQIDQARWEASISVIVISSRDLHQGTKSNPQPP